ncbi:MAG: hypothetical protein POELPBGB_03537 [Bacteroidia bacterium]|nr:hypothetical protein [Bacteroidia bacterium]
MTTIAIKKELHKAVDNMPDAGFLKAVYALFKEYSQNYNTDFELSPDVKSELDKERKLHKAGKSKSYSVAEVRKIALGKLKK